jgi:general stress protein YciG
MAENRQGSQGRGENLSDADRSKGGSMSGGNFANDPERASEEGRKGAESRNS